MDAMTSESKKTRRRYGAQFKAMVLAQCEELGVSVAQVAMSARHQRQRGAPMAAIGPRG
jgi:ribosomal protein L32